MFPWD